MDEEILRRMWGHATIAEISLALGCSAATVTRRASALGLPRKRSNGGGVRQPDPTPEEVAERMAQTQGSWSPKRRKRRAVVKTPAVRVHTMKLRH